MKYLNPRRIARNREREEKRRERESKRLKGIADSRRRYMKGNGARNARLMLDALGNVTRRHMLMRLHEHGEMALSTLVAPLDLTLPGALQHLAVLERANLVTTRKWGRLRLCSYNPAALKELSSFLNSARLRFEE